jgi:hypothetical protein
VRNGADGRRADTSDRKPVRNTYADITIKGVQRKPLESVRKALLSLSRINPIVRTVELTLFTYTFLVGPVPDNYELKVPSC